jgi:DNA-nicking Smr family endonuclease
LEEEPVEIPITDSLDLHSFAPADVKGVVQEYLEQCAQRGYRYIRIIHGKGTGVQKSIVRSVLERSELVESFSDGPDWGSTVIVLCGL